MSSIGDMPPEAMASKVQTMMDSEGHWIWEDRLRYKNAHRLRDINLLRELWPLNNAKEEIVPSLHVSEVNAKIQKKHKRVVTVHRDHWCALSTDQRIIYNLPLSKDEIARRVLDSSNKIIGMVRAKIPKVNGQMIRDISGCVRTDKLAWEEENERGLSIFLYYQLRLRMGCKLQLEDYHGCIEDARVALAMFPPLSDNCGIPHPFETSTLVFHGRAKECSGDLEGALDDARCCAAAMRLAMHLKEDYQPETIQHLQNCCKGMVTMVVRIAIKVKVSQDSPRPFFNIRELDQYEKDLGIGMYSQESYKCRNCSVFRDKAKLKACSACLRAWYCSRECQESDWTAHKSCCGDNWRKKSILGPLDKAQYEAYKANVFKGHGVTLMRDRSSGGITAFCVDPETDELFDGWTDQPYHRED